MRALLIALVLVSGCSRSRSVLTSSPAELDDRPAIILVPGFYGSTLRTKDSGRRFFISVWETLFGQAALSLFQAELGTPSGPELQAEGLMASVPVIPALYSVDVYGATMRHLQTASPESQVVPFAYDWRGDVTAAARNLDVLVGILHDKHAKSITLVSHSMGGLVVAYYLAYGAQAPETAHLTWAGARRVEKAVFAGTPFFGTMVAFRSFEKGSRVVPSKYLLPADAMASFPSMYELLPASGHLLNMAGEKTAFDLLSPEAWRKNRFGLLRRADLGPRFLDQRERFTADWLARSRRFANLLRGNGTPPPPALRVLNLVGSSHETLESGYVDPAGRLFFDPPELENEKLSRAPLFADGDGTVTVARAHVPEALLPATKEVVIRGGDHATLFLDPAAEKEYKQFLETPAPTI